MSRRVLCLLALLFVTDAITVYGRGPRAPSVTRPDISETARLQRQYGLSLA
jgi:hypothetical protein